jgi:hypothetical protein
MFAAGGTSPPVAAVPLEPLPLPVTPLKIINDSEHGGSLLQHGIHQDRLRKITEHLPRKLGIPEEIPIGYILATSAECFEYIKLLVETYVRSSHHCCLVPSVRKTGART